MEGLLLVVDQPLAVVVADEPGTTYATWSSPGATAMIDGAICSPGTLRRLSWPVAGSIRHSSVLAVDAAACVDQHQLVASVDEHGVDLQSYRPRRVERGCEQASCVLGPIAPQRFGRERERAVADDGDLDSAELEAVEARLRPRARLGRMGEGGAGGGECGGPGGGRAGTQERPAIEHEHVCSPLRAAL